MTADASTEGRPTSGDSWARRAGRVALRADARQGFLHEWRRALLGEPSLPAGPIRRVAVVCAGNICRSPFAAALLARARPRLAVESFGLRAADGHPAHPSTLAIAREWGADLSGHRTRPLAGAALAAADLVLVMEAAQERALRLRWPDAAPRVRLLGDFLPARPFAIEDPWSRPDAEWRRTFARIEQAVARLAERLGDAP